jgi:tripartite-type tricarboxylate transporter receptor subunit TctC
MLKTRRKLLVMLTSAACAMSATSYAQTSYPSRPVSVIVPVTPGGPSDLVARYLADQLSGRFKGNFVVENRPGASHTIGTNQVARSAPDGYTLLQAASNMSMNPAVRNDLPYDAETDFKAISLTHETPLAVTVSSDLKVDTLKDLVDLMKKDPAQLSYGTTGEGSPQRMATLLLMSQVGAKGLQEVAYKGSSQAHPDLISNRLSFMIDPVAAVAPHVQSGRLKVLAVTTKDRQASLPNVPTVGESLGTDYAVVSWGGMFAPKETPDAVVQQLSEALAAILSDEATKAKLLDMGLVAKSSSPSDFNQYLSKEIKQWKKVVAAAN